MQRRVENWKLFIAATNQANESHFRRHARTGRPLGDEGFVQQVSKLIGRDLIPKKPGRKKLNRYCAPNGTKLRGITISK